MKKFLLSIAAVMAIAFTASAKDVKDNPNPWDAKYLVDGVYSFPGQWAGSATFLGDENNPYDASANDYAYIKISSFEGEPIRFAVEYNKFLKEESWGKSFEQKIELMKADGIYYIELDKTSKADGGKTYAEEIRQLVVQDDGKAGSLKIEEIGFCTKAELDEMLGKGGNDEPSGEANKCLKVSVNGPKDNAWDSQILISFPKSLEASKEYTLKMKVKSAEAADGMAMQPIVEWNASTNRDQWDNSADLQYMANFVATTEWADLVDEKGNDIVSNGAFTYDRLILNIGKFNGDLFIDDVRLVDADGADCFVITFDTDEEFKLVEKRGWHDHVTFSQVDSDAPTGIANVEVASDEAAFNLFGQKSNGNGFTVKGGKVYLVK